MNYVGFARDFGFRFRHAACGLQTMGHCAARRLWLSVVMHVRTGLLDICHVRHECVRRSCRVSNIHFPDSIPSYSFYELGVTVHIDTVKIQCYKRDAIKTVESIRSLHVTTSLDCLGTPFGIALHGESQAA